jgi:subtilisin family serine protease
MDPNDTATTEPDQAGTAEIGSRMRRFGRAGYPPTATSRKLLRYHGDLDGEGGHGIRIALLDSGIYWEHPVFQGAAVRVRDFTGRGDLDDPTGHGTASASLLVGQVQGGFEGLAPRSEMLFARVLGAGDRDSTIRAVVKALRWAVERGAHIIVLPFGTRRHSIRVARAVAWARRADVTILAAAGNRGPEELCFPAWLDEVVAVTGVDAVGHALPQCCSLERADLGAPGDDVSAIGPRGLARLHGSSPAAVLAAGVEALHRVAHRKAAEGCKPVAGLGAPACLGRPSPGPGPT